MKEEGLEECFVTAFNHILARKEEIVANYAECLDAITDDSALQARMEAIQLETSDLTTLINNLLVSSKQRGGNEDINKRYEEYISRHEALQQEKLELSKLISLWAAKRLLVNAFLSELAKIRWPSYRIRLADLSGNGKLCDSKKRLYRDLPSQRWHRSYRSHSKGGETVCQTKSET